MNVIEAINTRRAYRSLAPATITEELVRDLAKCAQLAPTCFNYQPARFVFVWDPAVLEKMKTVFSKGNVWCHADSLIVAVFAEKDADCIIKDREYYLFDTGMQTAFLILRATELNLATCWMAGINSREVERALGLAGVHFIGRNHPQVRAALRDSLRDGRAYEEYAAGPTICDGLAAYSS